MTKASAREVLHELHSHANPVDREGMAHFGIKPGRALGIRVPVLRAIAKRIGKDHALAGELWRSGIHEARILASMIDDPGLVTERQMESWAAAFDAWDVCDQVCGNLFDRTPFARRKALEWSRRPEEFVKRAGFALMAWLALHDKRAADEEFEHFLTAIEREASDDRNFVKKAVNWALRGIGKRNARLHRLAVACAKRIARQPSRAAKWVASDALRGLNRTGQ